MCWCKKNQLQRATPQITNLPLQKISILKLGHNTLAFPFLYFVTAFISIEHINKLGSQTKDMSQTNEEKRS